MSQHYKKKRYTKEEIIRYKAEQKEQKKKQFDELYKITHPTIVILKNRIAENMAYKQKIIHEEELKCKEEIHLKTNEYSKIIKESEQNLSKELLMLQKVCDHDFQGKKYSIPSIMYSYPADKIGYVQTHEHLFNCKYCDIARQYCR